MKTKKYALKQKKKKKGVAQNLEEMSISSDGIISYIPKVYNGSDKENGLWIVTQYVLPAKVEDFKKVIGVDFNDVADLALNTDRSMERGQSFLTKMADNMIHHLYEKYDQNDMAIELFNDIHEIKADYDQYVGDLSRIENWGLAYENGQAFLVMLDIGLSEEVFNQFYRRR